MTRRSLVPPVLLLLTVYGSLGAQLGPVMTAQSDHLTVAAAVSADRVAPGQRLTLVFDITPRRNIHVYAPGKHTYRVVRVMLQQQPWMQIHRMTYPRSEIYHFKPLNERVPVYQQPFQLAQDVSILSTEEARKHLAGQSNVTISGRLEYQACDDKVCYSPQSVPVSWKLAVKPLNR